MSSADDSAKIEQLTQTLNHDDAVERDGARHQLAKLGSAAVPALIEALRDNRERVRWEAAKTLESIADPASAPALVDILADKDDDVRWVAGEALVAIGPQAVAPVLEALVKKDHPQWSYDGAHQVLHDLSDERLSPILQPVLKALQSSEPEIATPVEAEKALQKLRTAS